MNNDKTVNPKEILRAARNILLIDWPNTDVPKTLVSNGFTVFCYSPGRYTRAEMAEGQLAFRELNGLPTAIDIVNIYRPEQEHVDIISNHALPLSAKVIWLHPPIISEKTRAFAVERGLTFVEGISIAEVANK